MPRGGVTWVMLPTLGRLMQSHFRKLMKLAFAAFASGAVVLFCANLHAQQVQFPSSGLRPQAPDSFTPSSPAMVPVGQPAVAPPTGQPAFDPYSTSIPNTTPPPFSAQAPYAGYQATVPQTGLPPTGFSSSLPPGSLPPGSLPPAVPGSYGAYPGYNGVAPVLPGAGQSGTVNTFPNTGQAFTQGSVYPNAPSALFPGTDYSNPYGYPPQAGAPGTYPPGSSWNPQGSLYNGNTSTFTEFIRFYQGPRFRHAYLGGNNDSNALAINDSDLALAFAWPNFLFSTQPLYLMPSFSLHQWDGPKPPSAADLPAIAYSAFLDSGWQSDPARIWGAELGLRVGMFSDFNSNSSDSLRILGRAVGRARLTPKATAKLGVIYLDRVGVKILPAVGVLWQPNPDTRFDIFFPEPKLSNYLSTVGTNDTWWYIAGYYGDGSWTVQRTSGANDQIDINDIRIVLGLEWGRNEQLREGRRIGFFEVGYVFERELNYRQASMDNLDLQDTFVLRAGFGY